MDSNIILDPCELLKWDSDFFGFQVARVRDNVLTSETVQLIDAWCQKSDIRCLYFLSRADEPATSRLAEENGFGLVDVRMTFECDTTCSRPGSPDSSIIVRPFRSEDADMLQDIVGDSYRDTRFYFDVNFPRQLCDLLYKTWLKLSCEGYAQAVFISELEGLPVGYITCHIDEEQHIGKIGLVGVGHQAQGRGIGQKLVVSAVDWILNQGAQRVEVVTQGRNLPAQRLYQRCGFLTRSVQLWYHKWYHPVASNE